MPKSEIKQLQSELALSKKRLIEKLAEANLTLTEKFTKENIEDVLNRASQIYEVLKMRTDDLSRTLSLIQQATEADTSVDRAFETQREDSTSRLKYSDESIETMNSLLKRIDLFKRDMQRCYESP